MNRYLLKRFNLMIIILAVIFSTSIRVYALVDFSLLKDMNTILVFNNTDKEDKTAAKNSIDIDSSNFKMPEKKLNEEKCINRPQRGEDVKTIDDEDKITIIDSKDGLNIVDVNDKLYWSYKNNKEVEGKKVLYEVKEISKLKKGVMLDIREVRGKYYKIKTADGYYGWINSKFTKMKDGITYTERETKVYFTADLSPMNEIKNLKDNEIVDKIDERDNSYLIVIEGRMSWCSKKDANSISNDGCRLKVINKIKCFEAGYTYVYKKGENINIVNGSKDKAIKVKTPDGSFAWVLRDDVCYDESRNLVAAKNTKAYYTGNKEGNTVTAKGKAISTTAVKEVGYKEGAGNRTKYGDWYGMNAEWCGIFVSWCSFNSGIDESTIPKSSYCQDSVNWFMKNKSFYTPLEYTPKEGDIVYFYQGEGINHMGIVSEVSGDSITSIEGNMSDSVLKINHKLSDVKIAGYASPLYRS